MAVSNQKAVFTADIQKVWNVVTDVENYAAWRSDLSKTEMINETQFREFTKDGFATSFTITVAEPYSRLEFDMENENMNGHWIGIFTQRQSETEVIFTEDVNAKKFLMKPFVGLYLKKQQAQFIADLEKALT